MISESTAKLITTNSRASGRHVKYPGAGGGGVDELPLCGKDPWRYGMLLAYCLINIANTFLWISFSTVVDSAKIYYQITAQDVDSISVTYQYCYIAAFWFPTVLFPRTGLKYGLLIGGLLNVLCAVMRLLSVYAIPKCFAFLLVGNVFGGLSQVIVLAVPPMVSGLWFPPEERNRATAVGAASVFMGAALGLLAPTWVVNTDHNSGSDFASMHWMAFGIAVVTLMFVLPVPTTPRIPPSPASQVTNAHKSRDSNRLINNEDDEEEEELSAVASTLKLCLALLKNKNFILLNIVCCAFVGPAWELPALIPQIVKPFGMSSATAGWAGFIAEVSGMVGAIAAGFIANMVLDTKMALVLLGALAFVSIQVLLCIFSFGYDAVTPLAASVSTIVTWLSMSAFASAATPLLFELAVEVTFPIKEEVTGPILMWTTSVSSLIMIKTFGAIIGDDPSKFDACIVLGGNCVVFAGGVLAASFMSPKYLRREYEKLATPQNA